MARVAAVLALLLLAVGLLPYDSAQSGDTRLVTTIGSRHLERNGQCEFNPGLGVVKSVDERRDVEAGFYRISSCDRLAVYAGGTKEILREGRASVGVVMVLIVGYPGAPVLPAIGPALKLRGEIWTPRFVWFPNGEGNFKKGVIGMQAEWRWR